MNSKIKLQFYINGQIIQLKTNYKLLEPRALKYNNRNEKAYGQKDKQLI